MPIYDYVCHHCGHRFEVIHGVHADGPSSCPVCHSHDVRKGVTAPAVHFKGSGWAKKDRGASARKAASTSEEKPAAAATETGSSTATATASSDAAPESSSSTKPSSGSSTKAATSGSTSD
jgi:putative FmdB family regulatory protein